MDEELSSFLKEATERPLEDPLGLSIRELIGKWGARRRGYWIVSRIERDLDEAGLVTEPSFTKGWIDNRVRLIPKQFAEAKRREEKPSEGHTGGLDKIRIETDDSEEVGLQVGSLQSATGGVERVAPQTSLLRAESQMMRHDYSQLAVMSGPRSLVGAVTWESIAQTRMRIDSPTVDDCVVPVESVELEDDLLSRIPRIIDSGFVFVFQQDGTVSGIVTTSDLSAEFARLANPFFLLGEIERRLRRAIDKQFSPNELRAIQDPGTISSDIESASDLTVGEYHKLLENPVRWDRMLWSADRPTFLQALDSVREIRNDIMHFSPDPLDEGQLQELRLFIRWIKFLEGEPT